ncbi:MAG: hypothetical protein Q7S99_02300 [Parvibaculum sp.]|nr:hypothetical protein [Parvibaculum sp.]
MFKPSLQTDTAYTRTRSDLSHAFEALWRALPRDTGLIPSRASFRPELAARMLSRIALLDIHLNDDTDGKVTTKLRLTGGILRDLLDTDVTGLDYLDLVPDRAYQADHLRLCVRTPCAAWSLSPVINTRGYTSLVEITHFPLADEKTDTRIGLLLINEIGANDPETRTVRGPFEMKPAVIKQFIDIGAGVPAGH